MPISLDIYWLIHKEHFETRIATGHYRVMIESFEEWYTAVDNALTKIPADLSIYTDETVNSVIGARNAVIRGKDITEQEVVTDYANSINNAVAGLVYKTADYSEVDKAISNIQTNLENYTDETAKKVNEAKNVVVRNKNVTEQQLVNSMADSINSAVASLIKKVSTAVNEVFDTIKDITTENAIENKDTINKSSADIIKSIESNTSVNKKDIAKDVKIIKKINKLDDIFVAANENLTVELETPVVDSKVSKNSKLPSKPVEVQGLGLAVFGDNADGIPNDTKVSIKVEQQAVSRIAERKGVITLNIKPMMQVGSNGETVIDNNLIKTPVTIKVYLNDAFPEKYAYVKHVFDGKNANGTLGTDYEIMNLEVMTDDGGKYIVMTVTEFSEFEITPTSTLSQVPVTDGSSNIESPKTGDNSKTLIYVVLLILSLSGVCYCLIKSKKTKSKNNII